MKFKGLFAYLTLIAVFFFYQPERVNAATTAETKRPVANSQQNTKEMKAKNEGAQKAKEKAKQAAAKQDLAQKRLKQEQQRKQEEKNRLIERKREKLQEARQKREELDQKERAQERALALQERRDEQERLARQQRIENEQRTAQRRKQNGGCNSFLACVFNGNKNKNVAVRRGPGTRQSVSASKVSSASLREVVAWNDPNYKPGTLIVRTPERALYYVMPNGEALRYSIGVGREGFQWGGKSRITAKKEWPTWRPPAEMIKREAAKGHFLPNEMEGGPENPLGARALYIGGTIYRVHGTNNEASIGGAVSSGCIRMMNEDVIDLYERVKLGSPIFVYQ